MEAVQSGCSRFGRIFAYFISDAVGMRILVNTILILLVLSTGCDSYVAHEETTVSPDVEVAFVAPDLLDPAQSVISGDGRSKAGLNNKIGPWQVTLMVVSESGTDYSPEVSTQLISGTDPARFSVTLFPDSVYTFNAIYSQDGIIGAEGSTTYEVQKSTRIIPLDVVLRPPQDQASMGFKPAIVVRSAATEMVPLVLQFSGLENPVRALACKMQVSGILASRLAFGNADISLALGDRIDLAWSWENAQSGSFVIDTLLVPVDQISDITLSFTEGSVQVLEESVPRPLSASGARLKIVSTTDL